MSFLHTFLLFLTVSAVAIADVLLRKSQITGSFLKAISSPWMLWAVILYIFQIFVFTYLFVSGEKIVHIGIMQTVVYAAIILVAGIFLFGETLSAIKIAGVIFALVGVLLLNL